MASFKEYQMLFQLNASTGRGFQSTFQAGQSSITALQEKINQLNKTQSDISSYQKQQSAIEKTKAKIDLYQTQLTNLQSATAATSKEEAELANAIAAKEKQLTDATAKLDQQTAAATEMGQALKAAGVDTGNLTAETDRLQTEAEEAAKAQVEEAKAAEEAGNAFKEAMEGAQAALEAAGIVEGLKAIYGALMDCSAAAAEYETAMAGVKRTVGGDDSFISDLGETFKELSTQMPITATELASIATTAGQLGIAQENVQTFTTVMAQLATTTDLTADTAATMLAQFANITGVTDYERLGATVAALGDSTATTASKVVEMSQGMAAAANIAGMSETDILAISAAVGSLGIEAASGSTAMSTIISTLYKATETGEKLEEFASVAGMTADEFKTAWGENAVGALDAFIQGLNNTERNGQSAIVILDQLGIKNVRQTKAILGLASAGDLLSTTVKQANAAWNQNSALTEKAGIMYQTTEAKMTMMQNAANNVKIAIGDALNPAISACYDAMTSLLEPVAEWIEDNPAIVQGMTAFVAVLGVATAGVVAYTAATKLAAAASALFSGSIPGLGIILGIAGAVGVLTAGLSALGSASADPAKNFASLDESFDALAEKAKGQQEIISLADSYKTVSTELENIQQLLDGDFDATVTISAEGPADEDKLTPEDFVNGDSAEITGEAGNELSASDFGLSEQTVSFLATMDAKSIKEVQDKAESLRKEIVGVSTEINTAKAKLTDAQSLAAALQEKIDGTKNKKQKTALQEQLEEVNKTIEEQQTKISDLEKKQQSLRDEYEIVGTAAQELTEKEAELAAIKEELAASSDKLAAAANANAEAFSAEAEAARQDAEAQLALIRAQMYESIGSQARSYAAAAKESTKATADYNEASRQLSLTQQLQGMTADQVNEAYHAMLVSLDEMEDAEGFSPDAQAYKDAVTQAQEWVRIMSNGMIDDDFGEYADGMTDWADSFGYLSTNTTHWATTLEGLNEAAVTYKNRMDEADQTQSAFIENLVNGVTSGAVEITEVEARLKDALAGEEDAEATVAAIMEDVRSGVEAATQAKEEYAEASETVADATAEESRSVDQIIENLNQLKEAYNEAYNSAYSSMSGQFGLFEDASKAAKEMQKGFSGGTKGMTKNVQSQTKYVQDYTANYQLAQQKLTEAGVSAQTVNTILASLSDGSVESGQALASIASGSVEEAQNLAAAYENLEAAKTTYAETVAEIQTNFTETLTGLTNEMATMVEGLDFSADAAAKGLATIEAFGAAIKGYAGTASQKAAVVADAITSALDIHPVITVSIRTAWSGILGRLLGHARGTENAQEGLTVVGEEGPELMWMNGGEKIMNHTSSVNYAKRHLEAETAEPVAAKASASDSGGGKYTVDYSPVYNFSGGMAADDVKNVLAEHSRNMREEIEGILDEITDDNRRRKYA